MMIRHSFYNVTLCIFCRETLTILCVLPRGDATACDAGPGGLISNEGTAYKIKGLHMNALFQLEHFHEVPIASWSHETA